MNLSIEKIDSNIVELNYIFDKKIPGDIYCLKLLNQVIGYSKINKSSPNYNPFEIYIFKQFRGNGYSKYLFKEMLYELQKNNYNEIFFKTNRNDYILKRLIEQNRGIRISQDDDITTYVIPLNNL